MSKTDVVPLGVLGALVATLAASLQQLLIDRLGQIGSEVPLYRASAAVGSEEPSSRFV